MNKISQKQKKDLVRRKKVQALLMELAPRSSQYGDVLCPQCGKLPDMKDGRGELHLCHEKSLAQGGRTSYANCYLACRACHNGVDGHRTENVPHSQPIDRPPMPCMGDTGLHPYPTEMQTGQSKRK